MSTPPGDARTDEADAPEGLEVADIGHVRLLTFNRPSAANAFNSALYRESEEALRAADQDDAVSVVVLTGRGRHFSSGTDLVEMAALVTHLDDAQDSNDESNDESDGRPATSSDHPFSQFSEALLSFRKPLLAAVNGTGIGLGFTLLLHCDLVCIASDARLRAPFTVMGVAPEAGSSYLMPRRMGVQQATYALLSSNWVAADQAVASGLALKMCDPDTVVDETLAIAREIAQHPLESLIATKALLREPEREHVERAIEREGEAFAQLLRRPDAGSNVIGQLSHGTAT
jgi:enoyl-CoA hydratase/carnithine racemase